MKFSELHNQIASVAYTFWKDESCLAMLKPTYMVSRMVLTLPSVPQVAHTDFDDSVVNGAKHKLFVVFALASSEGCMLLVWTKDLYVANNQEYFCHFYVYIPYGSIVFLPGNMVHAGGFTFGQSSGKEYMNQGIHFYICNGSGSDDKTLQDAVNGKNYNCYAPEYVPEPGLLAIMQQQLNDSL